MGANCLYRQECTIRRCRLPEACKPVAPSQGNDVKVRRARWVGNLEALKQQLVEIGIGRWSRAQEAN